MSNVAQNEISNSRLKKGKEKVGEGSSKKRSDVWNYFTKELQPDGTQKAKCQICAQLLCCDPKKHGTSQLKKHLEKRNPDGSCPKRRKKAPDCSSPNRPENAAKSTLPLVFSEFPENQLGAQRNTELSGYQENHLEYVPHINEEIILGSDQPIHQNEINLGHGTQNNQGISRHQRIHSECDARTNQENHLGLEQHIDLEIHGSEEDHWVYDPQKNRELFVRMIIDNKSMLKHVDNPFLKEFAMTLQPDYNPMTRRDVEKGCLNFYEKMKATLKDKFSKLTSRISVSEVTFKRGINFAATHFIDEDFKLVKRIINFNSEGLLCNPKGTLNDWGLPEKCFAFTKTYTWSNFLENNITLEVNCILQCFHSIAHVFYSKIGPDIISIKLMMRDLNEFPEKMCYFNQIASYHNLATKFEFLDYRSGVMGSKIHIINDACTYKNVFATFRDTNIGWSEIGEIVGILNQINDVAVMISSLELPTSNLLHKFVFRIHDVLSRASPVFLGTKEAIQTSIEKLDEYLVGCDKIMLIASLLDPRFKLRFIERCNEMNICKEKDSFECFNNLYIEYLGYLGQSIETHTPNCWEHIPELKSYLQSSSVDEGDENFDVLGWWKDNKSEYPILSVMARDILAIPISSTILSGSEPASEIIEEIFDTEIDEEMSKVLVCCNNWLRSDCSAGKFVAGIESIIEKSHINQPEHSNKGNSCTYDENKCKELLVKLVISSKIPFHCVESTWFIEWAKNLQSSYSTVNPKTIMADCLCFFQKERQRLQDDLEKHVGKVCFSAHNKCVWEYQYIYVAIHYIDNHFKLVRRTVGMDILEWIEWIEEIRPRVERYITSWGTRIEILSFISDMNLYNVDIGGKYSLKLICVEQLFISLWNLIWRQFGRVLDMILSKEYRLSTFYDEAKNRFNFLQFYDAVACKETHELCTLYGERFLSIEEWDELKSAVKFLEPIYEAFNILSSSQYPVSNLFLKIVFEIRDVLSYVVQNTDFEVFELEDLLEIIDDNLKDCNNILLVASLLDPRFKKIYMDRCYREHISHEDEIDKYISELLHKYEIIVRQECEFPHGAESQLGMSELKRYLEHNHVEVRDAEFDVLRWWEGNKSTYPILARMARDILAIPVFSFSPYAADLDIDGAVNITYSGFYKFANQFGPKTLEMMVCSNNWLSVACDNDETTYGEYFQNRGNIDLARKYIPPSYQCPLRVCDVLSLNFLKHLRMSGEMSKEMVAIGVGILTAKNMQCLIKPFNIYGRSRCIPDDVINCYIGIMNNQKRTSGNGMVLNTIDTQQLESWASLKDENEKPCECIERGNDFLEKELVFLPIHFNKHWIVGVLNALKEFQILNSLNSVAVPYDEAINKLRSGIQVCIDAALDSKGISLRWRPEKILNWPISVIQNLPQQNDRCSSGLFALKYMQFWDGSKLASEFSQDDIDLFRKQLVGELIFSDLNERKDIQNEVRKEEIHYYDSEDESEVNPEEESYECEVYSQDESD